MITAFTISCSLALAGCSVERPSLGDRRPDQVTARSGHVFLVRGLLGIFSTGMDDLTESLQANGVQAVALQHTNERSAARLIEEHPELQQGPLVIVGHSLGAGAAVEICDLLAQQNIPVDLLITLDPISADQVPPNVRHAVNFYRSGGVLYPVPLFKGVALRPNGSTSSTVQNVDLNRKRSYLDPGTNHFNIDTSAKLQDVILSQILATCPPEGGRGAQVASGQLRPNSARVNNSKGAQTSQ